jgi:hypothetical protein
VNKHLLVVRQCQASWGFGILPLLTCSVTNLLQAKGELEDVTAQLSSKVALSAEDQRRLSLAVQGLETTKAGLARRVSV